MQWVRSNISFPNGIRAKSLKYVGPGCSLASPAVKRILTVMLVILLFNLLVLLFKCNNRLQVDEIYTMRTWSLRPHYLLHTYLSLICFLFFHQVVWKPLKFISDALQTNESFLNESNFPSFLSLCAFILGHCLGKCLNNFCINIVIKVY